MDYNDPMLENQMVCKLLEGIKVQTMKSGKTTVLADNQKSNTFSQTANYLAHFVVKKKKVPWRKVTSAERGGRSGRGRGRGCSGSGGHGRHGRGGGSQLKPGDKGYPSVAACDYSSNEWKLLTWEDKQKVFRMHHKKEMRNIAVAVVKEYRKRDHAGMSADKEKDQSDQDSMISAKKAKRPGE